MDHGPHPGSVLVDRLVGFEGLLVEVTAWRPERGIGDENGMWLEMPQRADLLGGRRGERFGRHRQHALNILRRGDQGDNPARDPERNWAFGVPGAQPPDFAQGPRVHLQPLREAHQPRPAQDGAAGDHRQQYVADRTAGVEQGRAGHGLRHGRPVPGTGAPKRLVCRACDAVTGAA
ncbi:hypothetical protein GCM10009534_15290 [Kribbella sandramycini]